MIPINRSLPALGLTYRFTLVPLPTGAAACAIAVAAVAAADADHRVRYRAASCGAYYLSLLLDQREHAPTLSTVEGWVSLIRFTSGPSANTVNHEDHRTVPKAQQLYQLSFSSVILIH